MIIYGRYRILTPTQLWAGTWTEGYSKIADISTENGVLTIVKAYVKIPKAVVRILQKEIDRERQAIARDSEHRSCGSVHEPAKRGAASKELKTQSQTMNKSSFNVIR